MSKDILFNAKLRNFPESEEDLKLAKQFVKEVMSVFWDPIPNKWNYGTFVSHIGDPKKIIKNDTIFTINNHKVRVNSFEMADDSHTYNVNCLKPWSVSGTKIYYSLEHRRSHDSGSVCAYIEVEII